MSESRTFYRAYNETPMIGRAMPDYMVIVNIAGLFILTGLVILDLCDKRRVTNRHQKSKNPPTN